MADLIIKTDLDGAVPELLPPWDDLFIEALNSQVARIAPCLTAADADPGLVAEARLIVFQSVRHVTEAPRWIKSQTTGPFSVSYVTGGRGVLDADDRAALAGLCGASVGVSVGPRWSFPDPGGYDRLFVRPGGGLCG